ncbi:uncharacterized protein MELLADRAFT_109623 [Melampsora larici-populina 98AG31]|uniref:Uncharacterized protein n=1 Tax=Melampsora larici-populina (strain 98AG31 / pathotype 3-4-7) TaxID=747676 RepID=F4RX31_MELLP|nr:uncharacterized protein MELLADRAFT_109623 [Melampsora larici-populina 98AG31]EGG02891.1 hypothetical protein MELLADRAFT_109623 [Melampsora larici-populina 98AG31]
MLNRQNERLTNYENLGLYDRPSSAYGISPPDSRWNRDNTHNYRSRSNSTYNADQYDSSNLGRLAYANERLSSARVQQAEQALRNFHAKTGQLYGSSTNGYNNGGHLPYLHQDLEAPRMRAIDLMSAGGSSSWNTPRSLSHGDYEYMFPARANYLSTEFGNLGLSNYHSRPSSRMWGNGDYNTPLRRSSSGTALAGYGCAY